jgi:serine/threonine protein kinase
MLIVNDSVHLGEGFFSETFLGFYVDDETGEKQQVIVKQVTERVILKQLITDKKLSDNEDSIKDINIKQSDFTLKKKQLNELLKNEASIAKNLSHSNLIRMVDFVKFKGKPSLVYQYVDCGTLDERLKKHKSLYFGEWIDLLEQLSTGLAYLHGFSHLEGLIHMDLCPKNILLDSKGQIKIGDFGLTQVADIHIADNFIQYITDRYRYYNKNYSAPELEKDKKVYQSSDLWSLALTLFIALTGKPLKIRNKNLNDIAANDINGRRKVIRYIYRHIENKLLKIDIQLIPEIKHLFRSLLAKPEGKGFHNAVELFNWIKEISSNSESKLGKWFVNIAKSKNHFLKAYSFFEENLAKKTDSILEIINSDNNIEKSIKQVTSLIDEQEKIIISIQQEIKKTCELMVLSFSPDKKEGIGYTTSIFDTIIGQSISKFAISYFQFLQYCNSKNSSEIKKILNENFSDFVLQLANKTKEFNEQAIHFLSRSMQCNFFASNCSYLYTIHKLFIAWIDTKFYSTGYNIFKIFNEAVIAIENYCNFTLNRPSFENLFYIEKLHNIFQLKRKNIN